MFWMEKKKQNTMNIYEFELVLILIKHVLNNNSDLKRY